MSDFEKTIRGVLGGVHPNHPAEPIDEKHTFSLSSTVFFYSTGCRQVLAIEGKTINLDHRGATFSVASKADAGLFNPKQEVLLRLLIQDGPRPCFINLPGLVRRMDRPYIGLEWVELLSRGLASLLDEEECAVSVMRSDGRLESDWRLFSHAKNPLPAEVLEQKRRLAGLGPLVVCYKPLTDKGKSLYKIKRLADLMVNQSTFHDHFSYQAEGGADWKEGGRRAQVSSVSPGASTEKVVTMDGQPYFPC